MTEKRVARSHPRNKTMHQRLSETWEFAKFMLLMTAGILFIGFIEAL